MVPLLAWSPRFRLDASCVFRRRAATLVLEDVKIRLRCGADVLATPSRPEPLQDLSSRRRAALTGLLQTAGDRATERLTTVLVQVITLVVDNQIQNRPLR
jgi:hypothetical protein